MEVERQGEKGAQPQIRLIQSIAMEAENSRPDQPQQLNSKKAEIEMKRLKRKNKNLEWLGDAQEVDDMFGESNERSN